MNYLGAYLSNVLGLLSSLIFLFVLLPQMHKNYKSKNSDAVSLSLILLWIVGDFLSMFSAQVKNISIVVVYTAIYHIVLGLLFAMQIMYYRYSTLKTGYISLYDEVEVPEYDSTFCLTKREQLFVTISSIVILFVKTYFYLNLQGSLILANLVAWSTTFIFVSSRIPQILLNHKRKSTEGLSVYSFVLLNIANYLFLFSILVNILDVSDKSMFITNNMQWIVGATATSFLDIIIFYQFWIFK